MTTDFRKYFDIEKPGIYIKKKREFFQLTQEELSFLIGVHSAYICEIETGRKKPSLEVLKKLLYVLNGEIELKDGTKLKNDVKKLIKKYNVEMKKIKQAKKGLNKYRDKKIT